VLIGFGAIAADEVPAAVEALRATIVDAAR
jgi:hypothetical protein